jgi:hypothetical protein
MAENRITSNNLRVKGKYNDRELYKLGKASSKICPPRNKDSSSTKYSKQNKCNYQSKCNRKKEELF